MDLRFIYFQSGQPHRAHPFPAAGAVEVFSEVRSACFRYDLLQRPGSVPEYATCLRGRKVLKFRLHQADARECI